MTVFFGVAVHRVQTLFGMNLVKKVVETCLVQQNVRNGHICHLCTTLGFFGHRHINFDASWYLKSLKSNKVVGHSEIFLMTTFTCIQ